MPSAAAFRFDAANHDYINLLTGESYPHITGMLEQTGWIDDRWYSEESSARGTAVHRLTADYDLKALDIESCQSIFRGYLLAHVQAVTMVLPKMLRIEEPLVHAVLGYGGRPDRDCLVQRVRSTWEIKTGEPERSHQIQTALQAILIAQEAKLPPESIGRFACYIKDKGKFKLEQHKERRDFQEARRVIRECCQ